MISSRPILWSTASAIYAGTGATTFAGVAFNNTAAILDIRTGTLDVTGAFNHTGANRVKAGTLNLSGGTLGCGRALHAWRLLRSKLRRALCVTLDVTFRRGRVLHPRRLLRSALRRAPCVTLRRGLALHPRRALCVAFYLTFRGGLLLDLRRSPRVTFGRWHPLSLRRTRIRAGAAMLRPEFPIAAR